MREGCLGFAIFIVAAMIALPTAFYWSDGIPSQELKRAVFGVIFCVVWVAIVFGAAKLYHDWKNGKLS